MRRVVVTGMGMVTPLGRGVEANWKKILGGVSGIRTIDTFDVSDFNVKIAGLIPRDKEDPDHYDPDTVVPKKEQRKQDPFITYGLCAGIDAVEDSGWKPESEEDRCRTGVIIGAGIGGLGEIASGSLTIEKSGPRRISPFFIPASLINLTSGHLSIKYGFKGPNHSVVTACATGTHAIGDAFRMIQFDDADVMVAGGSEAAVHPLGLAGFQQAKALCSTYNDDPTKASRPWDKDHCGFVMGEGGGVVVLEELEHAKKRGAKIYGEVIGYGMSGDAHHITAPASDGNGGFRAMQAALKWAKTDASKVDYVNAHGTSTPVGDPIEHGAVKRLLGAQAEKARMSSTKSMTGHLLGAAGAIEAIYTCLALRDQVAPPTINLDNPAEGCDMNLVPHTAQECDIDVALSNSFGFGGTNASLVMRKA